MTQQQPVRIESRVSATERRQLNIEARLEELSEDMATSFAQQTVYQVGIEQKIDALRVELKADMVAMEGRILGAFQQLVAIIEQRLPGQKGE